MNVPSEKLADRLMQLLGADAVSRAPEILAACPVDDLRAQVLCQPDTADKVAAVLSACAEAEAAVAPWGGGTAIMLGNVPKAVDVVLQTHRLNQTIDYDHANLTVTVQCGTTAADLARLLAHQQQCFPIDAPLPGKSTLGGIVAANLNGPRRSCYGSIRDLVIGMKVALVDGQIIKAGGKVVKNVAGYDLCKLFTGSLGTLGVITELTVRVSPLPQRTATIVAEGDMNKLMALNVALSGSPLLPAAMVWKGQLGVGREHQQPVLAFRCEGFDEAVQRQLDEFAAQAGPLGLPTQMLDNGAHETFWREVNDFPGVGNCTIYRITVPRGMTAECLTRIAAMNREQSVDAVCDLAGGTLWLSCEQTAGSPIQFGGLVKLAAEYHGHAIMFAAPADTKRPFDIWGPAPPTLKLMQAVKQQFDAKNVLNCGRYIGRI